MSSLGEVATLKPLPADAIMLVPMRNTVLFPGVISPVTVGRPGSVAAAKEAVRSLPMSGPESG